MTLLALDRVDAFYGAAHILHGVSLAVGAGERVAILGRNGAGKTTIVNVLLGIAALRCGSIAFGAHTPRKLRPFTAAHHGVAVVPQGRRIVPGLSVAENLLLGAATGRGGPWQLDRVFDLFPILRERAGAPGTAMSGGQQQMLAIGRALMANPDLLILDEPSEGLAPVVVDELAATLVQLAHRGTSILLIEQNFSLVHRVAARYCVLAKGSIVDTGTLAGLSMEVLKQHVAV
jgi:ABC-type branched-subunit amino acid transport system ATPase component